MAIIASGPSAKEADIPALSGLLKVIAIKENVDLCPWADLVYGCDAAWWEHRKGLPDFLGLKVCWSGNLLEGMPDIRRIEIAPGTKTKYTDDLVTGQTGTVGGGGNSGFQALNLAAQFGARRILLIGFDMTECAGIHWYGRNRWPKANNPDRISFRRWVEAFNVAAPRLSALGITVFNASPLSALTCFEQSTIEQFLAGVAD